MDLLQELIGLTEVKSKKKHCCKKCEMKATKEMADKIINSKNVAESVMEVFSQPLNEGTSVGEFDSGDKEVFVLFDDIENDFVSKIAKSLGVHDGGNLKKIGTDFFASYIHGQSLVFYKSAELYDTYGEHNQ